MKSFKSFISEEVLPTARVEDGNFNLENDAVRDQINSILAGITSHSHITPYITLRKVSKALAYFSIILPKRTFLDGNKGVEVYELKQFGDRMGMTDQGEFVREVPVQFYLFFQYLQIMGKFMVVAKVVDKAELDKMLDTSEMTMKECWDKVTKSQRDAPRDEIQTDGNNGTVSTKKAMDTSERTKDKKLANGELDKEWPAVVKEDNLDEVSLGKLVRYKNEREGDVKATNISASHSEREASGHKATGDKKKHKEWSDEAKWLRGKQDKMKAGIALADRKMKGKAKVNASMPKHPYMEETIDEADYKSSYAYKKMKTKVATKVKQGLGIGKEKTNTILVTNKGDPKASTGGGVHRIPRDKYDPSKHNMASE